MQGTLLIVDDERPIRKLLTRLLENVGYECVSAENVASAKEALATREFDLLLCDLKMPEESGLGLISYAKEHYPRMGRVMITAFSSPDIVAEIMAVGVYGYIIKPISRDGVLITVENALRHLHLDNHIQAYKKELENQLSQRNAQLSAIMDHLQVGVMMVDTSMKIIKVNQKMQQWFSKSFATDGVCCYHAMTENMRQDCCPDCPILETFTTGTTGEKTVQIATINGRRHFRVLATPIRDNADTIYAAVALYEDVTEKIAMEHDLRQAQKLEAVGQLAAGIAHEINTPIQYIGDNTTFLQDSFADITTVLQTYDRLWQRLSADGVIPKDMNRQLAESVEDADLEFLLEDIPKALQQSQDGVQRVGKIARAMKDFSHPGGEEMAPMDINKIVRDTITVCRNEWKYVAEMELELSEEVLPVPCFGGDISQVVLNIIVNGAHAIAGVTDNGNKGMGQIRVESHPMEQGVRLRISDSGGGIPEQARQRIFDPFFTTKEKGKGTGQGLAIAYRIVVEKHQGKLYFETESGSGTTFVIELPAEKKA